MHTIDRRHFLHAGCALLAPAALLGCASAPPNVSPSDTSRSIVYGYIDMSDAPSPVNWVTLRCYTCGEKPYFGLTARDGLFFHPAIGPGAYQIETFAGEPRLQFGTRKRHEYSFGNRGRNESAVRIERPDAYFMGAWKVLYKKGGLLGDDTFTVEPAAIADKKLLGLMIQEMKTDSDLKPYSHALALAERRYAKLA